MVYQYIINILILLNLFSSFCSEGIIPVNQKVEYTCNNNYDCSKKYYIDISEYKNDLITLNLYFSTPGYNIDLNNLYHVVSDNINENCKYRGGYTAYTYYDKNDQRMHANYHLNVTATDKYLIFSRSPVGNYFPLSMYFYINIVQYNYYKEESTSSKVLGTIGLIIGFIMLIGICYCVGKICPCCCESSSSTATYIAFRIN